MMMRVLSNSNSTRLVHFFKWMCFVLFILAMGGLCVLITWKAFLILLMVVVILAAVFLKYERCLYVLIILVPIASEAVGFEIKSIYNFILGLRPINLVSLAYPFIILFYLGFLIRKWAKVKEDFIKNPLRWIIRMFFLYASLTLIWSPNISHSLFQLFLLGTNLMLFDILIHAVINEKTHKKVMWVWIAWGGLQGLIAIILYFLPPKLLMFEREIIEGVNLSIFIPAGGYQEHRFIRRGAVFTTPLETALIMNMVFSVASGLFLTEVGKMKRGLLVAIMVLVITVVLLTMSRQGLLSLIIMGFSLLLFFERLRRRFFVVFSIFLIVIVLLFQIQHGLLNVLFKHTYLPPRLIVESIETEGGAVKIKESSKARLMLWKKGFDKLQETILMGAGIGNFKYYFKAPHAHNIYFSFLFDFGLMGLGIILFIFIILLQNFLKIFRYPSSYLQILAISFFGGMIAVGTHGMVDFEYNRPILWLYLGMTFATFNLVKREPQNRSMPSNKPVD
jgi:O-antigen ligase